jgi:ubiquinol-cytochrome c reductase cytochrome c1 subunit
MRTRSMRGLSSLLGVMGSALLATAGLVHGTAFAAEEPAGGESKLGANWKTDHADTDVANTASLQRGARNFSNYCLGCHSLKYERWSRMGQDLAIPEDLLEKDLMPPGDKPAQYVLTSMPATDAEAWFGKTPPDLSLMARARGKDYLYQFLTTFYVDPTRQTGANNLRLPSTAMPHVLSELEGLKKAVYRNVETAEYASFVRDTVNFLDYVGEPTQQARRSLGVWVVLFLLVFTWLAWLMKKEYWKDVH